MDHPDDAAVIRLPGGDFLVQTLDLIAPIVNDPVTFGKIAAANSISDVYAMGGRPLTAMNVVCFPAKELPLSVLKQILEGAIAVLDEAGCMLVGGHTVDDDELKFGLSVSGIVDEDAILSIDKAKVGDMLALTKPLGTGVVNQALRKDKIDDTSAVQAEAIRSMTTLNAQGAKAARAARAHAATDITGFGFLGHASQFARASNVTFEIQRASIPSFEGVTQLIKEGVVPKRARDNADAYRSDIQGLGSEEETILAFDPQTSGGLLVAFPEANRSAFFSALEPWPLRTTVVGRVVAKKAHAIELV